MRPLITSILLCATIAHSASAKPPLREVAEIDDTVMVVAIADEIRKTCDDIGARLIRAYATLNGLKNLAREKGYSEEEVEDYVTSSEEKTRMRAKAERYLASHGVEASDDAALCRYGKEQIRAQSAIGRLLK